MVLAPPDSVTVLRPDLPEALAAEWHAFASPGTWFTGTERVAGAAMALLPVPFPEVDPRLIAAVPARIRLSLAVPTSTKFGLQAAELVWQTARATRSDSTGVHSRWTDFATGEPAPLPPSDGSALMVFRCVQLESQGISCVRVV